MIDMYFVCVKKFEKSKNIIGIYGIIIALRVQIGV
jgi:hypothetical protein